jgi:putative membrane protein
MMADQGEQDVRVYLAVERTLLAWIRTGLALMGFGFVVARFGLFLRTVTQIQGMAPNEGGGVSLWSGTALILLGVLVHLLAAAQYVTTIARLRRGEGYQPRRIATGVILAALLALLGMAMAAYLLIL